jgi:16S rRNA (guanine966-N2)-methyltransferase
VARRQKNTIPTPASKRPEPGEPTELRIIGGELRGRKLAYSGESRTRPMKDRLREALFNLIGPSLKGQHAIDVFAGTGALGLEAVSRGAARATMIEQHFPTAAVVRQNVERLGIADRCEVVSADALIWVERLTLGDSPSWLVFCCPPYAFYVDRQQQMLRLVNTLIERAPAGSTLVVEADERFDMGLLPDANNWDTRRYPPSTLALYRKPA